MAGPGSALAAGLGGAVLGGLAVWAIAGTGLADGNRTRTERIVHDYLLDHPEILPEAMDRLQANKDRATVSANRSALERPFAGAWIGAQHPDVTLVEFTDYACGYCRASVGDLDRLIQQDKGLRIVFREIPILSPESGVAARAALAAARTGHYDAVHHALFAGGQLSASKISGIVQGAGLAAADLNQPEVSAELARNMSLAQMLKVDATPTFVVGDQVLQGAVGTDALAKAVAEARAAR